MKRPEGFDAAPEPPPTPRRSKATKPAKPVKPAISAAPAKATAPGPRKTRENTLSRSAASPSASGPRGSSRPVRTAPAPVGPSKRELRRAAKARRRFEREEVRRFTKRARSHRAVWVSAIGVVVGLAVMLAIAVFSPLLSFSKLEVTGAVSVDEAAVRDVVEAQFGTPLALIDHGAIREGLERFPLIRSYVTEMTPPGTLTLHLVERAPVGVLRSDSGFVVVDPAGVILSRPASRPENLPLINVDARGSEGVGFGAVVEVLLALPPSLRADVDTATATTRDDVRLALRSGGQSVVWGSADRSELKARVLEKLILAKPAGSRLEYDVSAPLSPLVRSKG